MGAHEIRTAVFSVSIPGISVMNARQGIKVARQCNEFGARIRDDDPAHFGFFATVPDPTTDIQAALKEIRYSIDELQADGVCLRTRYGKGNDYIGHELFRPLWHELDEPEAVVFVHPTHPAGAVQVNELTPFPVIDFTHETFRAALDMVTFNMLAEHPRCKVILSHASGTIPYITGGVAQVPPYTMSNCRMPTSSFDQVLDEHRNFDFDVAVASADLVLPLLIKFAKPGHILFASDLPYAPREEMDHFINSLNAYERSVDSKEVSAINRDNASRLFPRLQNRQSDRMGISPSVYSECSVFS